MNGKSLFGSKLGWTGILTMVVSFATWLQGTEIIAQYPDAVAWIGVGIGALTAILRIVTDKPITSVLPKK